MLAITALCLSLPALALDSISVQMGASLPSDGAVRVVGHARPNETARLEVEDIWERVTPNDGAGDTASASELESVGVQMGWIGVLVGLIGALRRSC